MPGTSGKEMCIPLGGTVAVFSRGVVFAGRAFDNFQVVEAQEGKGVRGRNSTDRTGRPPSDDGPGEGRGGCWQQQGLPGWSHGLGGQTEVFRLVSRWVGPRVRAVLPPKV